MVERLRTSESGHTLIELLLVCTMLIVVLSATLLAFERFDRGNRDTIDRTEANDAVRTQLSRLSRQLRNLASPTARQPDAIDLAEPDDIVFKSVDPDGPPPGSNASNVRRVRYCLGGGGANGTQRLIGQQQTWDTALAPATYPSTASCPDAAWGAHTVLAEHVVNGARRAFGFLPEGAALPAITNLTTTLYVDVDPQAGPAETRLRSGVYLRNQNRAPIARFTAKATGNGRVVLNGSTSEDPEGDPLEYVWFAEIGGVDVKLGEEVTCDCPSGVDDEGLEKLAPGTYPMWLVAYDSGNLPGTAAAQNVEVLP